MHSTKQSCPTQLYQTLVSSAVNLVFVFNHFPAVFVGVAAVPAATPNVIQPLTIHSQISSSMHACKLKRDYWEAECQDFSCTIPTIHHGVCTTPLGSICRRLDVERCNAQLHHGIEGKEL